MKKLLTLFAVLAFTAPVFADIGDPNVVITCVDEGSGVARVDYEVLVEDVDPGLMRGIAVNITTSNTATIDVITDYAASGASVPADSTQIPTGYSIYMGSLQFAMDPNYVSSFGDPVAPNTDPDALGGLTTTGITVEMGSLYEDGGTAPGASGTLFRLEVDFQSESNTTLTIAANNTRGGCVMEDGSPANVVSTGCLLNNECMAATNPAYNLWVGGIVPGYPPWPTPWSRPDCWCYPRQCRGDADGAPLAPGVAVWVGLPDLNILRGALSKMWNDPGWPAGGICADFDHATIAPGVAIPVSLADLTIIREYLSKMDMPPGTVVPICSGVPNCDHTLAYDDGCDTTPLPNSEYNFWTGSTTP